jgi:hypothetical protein
VFFSYTPLKDDEVLYRLCAVETVADKLDHRAVHRDRRFSGFRGYYLNTLIKPEIDGWRYDETDRHARQRHDDWFWRIADHRGITQEQFDAQHKTIYRTGRLPQVAVDNGRPLLTDNYILFTRPPDRAYISPTPPEVAVAVKGHHEQWCNLRLQALTVGMAASFHKSGRDYLRVANISGRNVHRQLRFDMPSEEANRWRDELIVALKEVAKQAMQHRKRRSIAGRVKC